MKTHARILSISLLVAGSLIIAPASFADTSISQAITAGALSVSVGNVPIDAVDTSSAVSQAASGVMTINITDLTGSGAGWHVTQVVSDFAPTSTMSTAGAIAIPAVNFVVTPASVKRVVGGSILPPTLGSSAALGTAHTVISAKARAGLGEYTFLNGYQLTVPANSYAGTYTATLTTSIVSGP